MIDRLWITWEIQRRNRSMSKELDATLIELISDKHRLIKYPILIIKTLRILLVNKPKVLFVQNPSIVLSFISVIFKKMLKIETVIVDCHNGGLFPLEGRFQVLNLISKYIVKKADITIVTNSVLADYVKKNGGCAVVIPDPLPVFDHVLDGDGYKVDNTLPTAAFICTWSLDEPYEEVVTSAKALVGKVNIYITGNPRNKINLNSLTDNVHLTGFLSEDDYASLLNSVDFLIVLTKRDNCLNCGAYEAVSLEKPSVLSDKNALKDYFNRGSVFTDNSEDSITISINEMVENLPDQRLAVKALKNDLIKGWPQYRENLEKNIV